MICAHLTNTPEPEVWRTYTLRMLVARVKAAPKVLPLLNPFAGAGEEQKALTDPDEIRAFLSSVGVRKG